MRIVDPNINSQNGTPRQENPELKNRHSRYKAPFISEVDKHGNETQAPDLKLALGVAAGGGGILLPAVNRSGSSNSLEQEPGAPPSPGSFPGSCQSYLLSLTLATAF
ncbi:hypothetical protein L211DRAFT_854330 [Terfezia boudieri ATCC MYA-4762]|uniref:Uncharacterized protein n=1 Tax=Terfezia boudieri ATCC MYA-4762 TaxID=1051890 RepID=A0A3N4LC49_9PEZI|nr:hypothetical protein L211DRAFT_854330 [Terfezia boudieri ATCC MYA-4762]